MHRKVELFIRKGIVKKQAYYHTDDHTQEYGEILIYNLMDKLDQRAISVFTHPRHSFTIPGPGPEPGKIVYFFAFPHEYLWPHYLKPGETDAMIAVNVSERLPRLTPKPGVMDLKRHPCGTTLTIESETVNSKNHFVINDYGELTIVHTTSNITFRPWTKITLNSRIVLSDPSFSESPYESKSPTGPAETKIVSPEFSRTRPKMAQMEYSKSSKFETLESHKAYNPDRDHRNALLTIHLDHSTAFEYEDPSWIWTFE